MAGGDPEARAKWEAVRTRVEDAHRLHPKDLYALGEQALPALTDLSLPAKLGYPDWPHLLAAEETHLPAEQVQRAVLLVRLATEGGYGKPIGDPDDMPVQYLGPDGRLEMNTFGKCTLPQLESALQLAVQPTGSPPPQPQPSSSKPQPQPPSPEPQPKSEPEPPRSQPLPDPQPQPKPEPPAPAPPPEQPARGGLAFWQVGLIGVAIVVGAFVLMRPSRPSPSPSPEPWVPPVVDRAPVAAAPDARHRVSVHASRVPRSAAGAPDAATDAGQQLYYDPTELEFLDEVNREDPE